MANPSRHPSREPTPLVTEEHSHIHAPSWLEKCQRAEPRDHERWAIEAGCPCGPFLSSALMLRFSAPLPIDDVLDGIRATLRARNACVLVAPPGAGKTTRVPLALFDEPWAQGGRFILLEPRRLAARAAAER